VTNFPLYRTYRASGAFGSHPFAADISEGDPILPPLEFFLSLKDVPRFKEKLEQFLKQPDEPRSTNAAEVQWASACAEIGAVCLLGKELGLSILAFDATSPRRSRPKSNCDIVARLNGQETFFEVKRNSKEETQSLPDDLQNALDAYDCPYCLTGELHDRSYDCSNLPELLAAIENHLALFHEWKQEDIVTCDYPPLLCFGGVFVHFSDKAHSQLGGSFFEPALTADLRSYLLESGRTGKDGKPMIPKVKEVQEKGAHYLMVRVPSWEGLHALALGCFENLELSTGRTYWTEEATRLSKWRGFIQPL
jgi:hypothetical protein